MWRIILLMLFVFQVKAANNITILEESEYPINNQVWDNMVDETQRIWNTIGVNILFKENEPGIESEGFTTFVSFKGECHLNVHINLNDIKELPALGNSEVVDKQVLPISVIFCDRIEKLLSTRISANDKQAEEFMGRAMARVLSHELYHVIGNTLQHDKKGIGQTGFSVYDLIKNNIDFSIYDQKLLKGYI